MAGRVLHVRNLGLRLSEDFAVLIEALDLDPGEVLVMDSASGTGKSTVLGLVSAAVPGSGLPGERLQLAGEPVPSLGNPRKPVPDRARFAPPNILGFVLQTSRLIPFLTLHENIELPARLSGLALDRGWVGHVLDRLGIASLMGRRPDQVSMGQRQRAAVARALVARPVLLLLDEPVSALDPANSEAVEVLISELAYDSEAAVLMASHKTVGGAFADAPRCGHRLMSDPDGVQLSLFRWQAAA